jgi:hypothetical protein
MSLVINHFIGKSLLLLDGFLFKLFDQFEFFKLNFPMTSPFCKSPFLPQVTFP